MRLSLPSRDSWERLLDDKALSEARAGAEKKYRDLTGDQRAALRVRAKSDLFFLSSAVLGYDLLSVRLHGHYMNWLRKVRRERYRMTLLPRDHYKSTGNTIADSIQMALPTDGHAYEYPYSLGPALKLLLAHENRESASRFLYEITAAFRAKPLMLALFDDCIPSPKFQRINKWELDIPPTNTSKEPTFDTIGVGGAAQGRHYNWLKLDDLFGEAARDSDTVSRTTLLWFDNINALLTRMRTDGWDLIGTRWSAKDVYAHAVKMYGVNKERSILTAYDERDIEGMEDGQLTIYARGALEGGQPIFPEEFHLADLERMRRSPIVWAAQYANNPRESSLSKFQPDWLKFYRIGERDRLLVPDGDGTREVRVRDLERLVLIDPAVGLSEAGDEWGIVVTGTDQHMNIYILEAYRQRMTPPEGIDEMFRLYMKWNPRALSIESVAFSSVLRFWFEEKCRDLGVYPTVHDYKPGGKRSKEGRIEGLANYGAGGQLFCLEGMHQLRDEWEWFPLGSSDHILDALAQGPELWTPATISKAEVMGTAIAAIQDERDALTGY